MDHLYKNKFQPYTSNNLSTSKGVDPRSISIYLACIGVAPLRLVTPLQCDQMRGATQTQAKWIKLDLHVDGSIVKTEQSINSYYSKELGVKQLYNLECEVQKGKHIIYSYKPKTKSDRESSISQRLSQIYLSMLLVNYIMSSFIGVFSGLSHSNIRPSKS